MLLSRSRWLHRSLTLSLNLTLHLALSLCLVPVSDSATAADVDFNRDVRGVLSNKCFLCHGPADSTRQGQLRLDERPAAIDSGAIVPGDPQASELIARITSNDPEMVMPPPETGKAITPQEAALLSAWIDQGARYDQHWAFVAPRSTVPPPVRNTDWPRNAIDHFVLARLESAGQSPSQPASLSTLARRLSLDLTGLPPSIESLNWLESESAKSSESTKGPHSTKAPESAERLLDGLADRLLASQHFGERWARWWLDAARYADSAGYEKDMQRQVWFYRDWVINALNDDMPYDQFLIQQIAGDLLPGAGQSQRVATGFLRNSMTNEEGGANPEQFRVEGMFDRMDAVGKAVLGLTTQCAQCHTHKYDPLSQREYYQMFAAMNDFHEACITVFTADQARQRDRVLTQIRAIEDQIRDSIPDWKRQVSRWAESIGLQLAPWQTMKPSQTPFQGEKFRVLDDGSILSESYAPTKSANAFSLTTHVGTITAVRFDAMMHPQLPRGGPGRSIDGTGAMTEFQLRIEPENGKPAINVKFVRAISDAAPEPRRLKPQYRDKDASKDQRMVGPASFAIDGDPKTAWTMDLGPGRSNQARHVIFVPESPVVVNAQAQLTFTIVQKHGGWNSDDNQTFNFGRYRFSITQASGPFEQTIATDAQAIAAMPSSQWSDDDWDVMFSQWRTSQASLADENERIESLWKQYPQTATQLVAQSRERPRETFVYTRGDFLKPADPVQPDAPAFLHAMSPTGEPDRLRFARWLASKNSPTTARVIVNRIWQAYFGQGLVSTPEDFGFQSQPPSHPQLLDYLATELVAHNWSLKHIHRLIVQSATYRQRSAAPADAWTIDPQNRLLARGPRMRVEAEMVRDIALSASGLLEPTMGGPSVYPPAPSFLFQPPTSYGPKVWKLSDGSAQFRRSLYVHQYRSVPYPPLQAFDAPKGDASTVKRARSNTPIQSLVLLNEPQFVDAAFALAARTLRDWQSENDLQTDNDKHRGTDHDKHHDSSADRKRIAHAFRLCTSRRPDDDETGALIELLDLSRKQSHPQLNEQLDDHFATGPIGCQLPAQEVAAWVIVCRAILNLDETISKP